jgi:hypothetical protein
MQRHALARPGKLAFQGVELEVVKLVNPVYLRRHFAPADFSENSHPDLKIFGTRLGDICPPKSLVS